jgi:hypothetical protein
MDPALGAGLPEAWKPVRNISEDRYVVSAVTTKEEGRRVTTGRRPFYEPLFSPATIGRADLKNRVALAPMTRVSATAEGVATPRIASYYGVYADGGFGLLITEGLYMDEQASQGYFFQPGIATPAHAEAWKPVVERVHSAGAKIFAQLMHAGSQSQGNARTTSTLAPGSPKAKCRTTNTVGQAARTTRPSSSLLWQRPASTTFTPPSTAPWHRLSLVGRRPWPNSPNNTAA